MSSDEWHLEVGSDVVHDEFFAELWFRGDQWGTVVERDGDYVLRVRRLLGRGDVEIDFDAAIDALAEARRRVGLADDDAQPT